MSSVVVGCLRFYNDNNDNDTTIYKAP